MAKVILAGGSGFLGRALGRALSAAGWEVVVLTRDTDRVPPADDLPALRAVMWNGETGGAWAAELEGAAALVNLAGRSINCVHSLENSREILDSRLNAVKALAKGYARAKNPPPAWVQGSATGFYGNAGDRFCEEALPPGPGFLAEVCRRWEEAFAALDLPDVRRVVLRLGPVLDQKTGPFPAIMSEWLTKFLQAFIPLFVAIDPIGLAAIFLGLGQNIAAERRQKIADQAVWTGGLVALGFLLLGKSIFAALGISVGDFQIAGGLILFILAAKDLVQSAAESEKLPEDFGVVPLGMPLIAGPASITTLLVLAQNQAIGLVVTLVALAVNLFLVVLALHYSEWLGRKVGATGMRAISKIIAMLLAAIAVNMIRQGWKT
jgi:multiple antibiotic resistance protein